MYLPTAIYTADRGYAWTHVPPNIPKAKLNAFCRMVAAMRGDFPDPASVDVGFVSDGTLAAVFTIQNVEHWDAEGRAANYTAFVFFKVEEAASIDFVTLLSNDFFWTPTHEPQAVIDYAGPVAQKAASGIARKLRKENACVIEDMRTIGSILAECGPNSTRWSGRMLSENAFEINCNSWNLKKGLFS